VGFLAEQIVQGQLQLELGLIGDLLAEFFDFNDGLIQSVQLFRSNRSGDLVLSAGQGYSLRRSFEEPSQQAIHGSLNADHMFVPFCINSRIDCEYIRTADLFPTFLKILGIVPDHEIDGRSLI
jgi:hypothetical protein